MHIHTLTLRSDGPVLRVKCDGCDIALRTATALEAAHVIETSDWQDDGPMLGPTNVICVPEAYAFEVSK